MHLPPKSGRRAASWGGIQIIEFEQTTRTPGGGRCDSQHPSGIGMPGAQIVKSCCVRGRQRRGAGLGATSSTSAAGRPRGVSRKRVQRADAETPKTATGFQHRRCAPFGHLSRCRLRDRTMTYFEVVWCGGTFAVFAITPRGFGAGQRGVVADLAADKI